MTTALKVRIRKEYPPTTDVDAAKACMANLMRETVLHHVNKANDATPDFEENPQALVRTLYLSRIHAVERQCEHLLRKPRCDRISAMLLCAEVQGLISAYAADVRMVCFSSTSFYNKSLWLSGAPVGIGRSEPTYLSNAVQQHNKHSKLENDPADFIFDFGDLIADAIVAMRRVFVNVMNEILEFYMDELGMLCTPVIAGTCPAGDGKFVVPMSLSNNNSSNPQKNVCSNVSLQETDKQRRRLACQFVYSGGTALWEDPEERKFVAVRKDTIPRSEATTSGAALKDHDDQKRAVTPADSVGLVCSLLEHLSSAVQTMRIVFNPIANESRCITFSPAFQKIKKDSFDTTNNIDIRSILIEALLNETSADGFALGPWASLLQHPTAYVPHECGHFIPKTMALVAAASYSRLSNTINQSRIFKVGFPQLLRGLWESFLWRGVEEVLITKPQQNRLSSQPPGGSSKYAGQTEKDCTLKLFKRIDEALTLLCDQLCSSSNSKIEMLHRIVVELMNSAIIQSALIGAEVLAFRFPKQITAKEGNEVTAHEEDGEYQSESESENEVADIGFGLFGGDDDTKESIPETKSAAPETTMTTMAPETPADDYTVSNPKEEEQPAAAVASAKSEEGSDSYTESRTLELAFKNQSKGLLMVEIASRVLDNISTFVKNAIQPSITKALAELPKKPTATTTTTTTATANRPPGETQNNLEMVKELEKMESNVRFVFQNSFLVGHAQTILSDSQFGVAAVCEAFSPQLLSQLVRVFDFSNDTREVLVDAISLNFDRELRRAVETSDGNNSSSGTSTCNSLTADGGRQPPSIVSRVAEAVSRYTTLCAEACATTDVALQLDIAAANAAVLRRLVLLEGGREADGRGLVGELSKLNDGAIHSKGEADVDRKALSSFPERLALEFDRIIKNKDSSPLSVNTVINEVPQFIDPKSHIDPFSAMIASLCTRKTTSISSPAALLASIGRFGPLLSHYTGSSPRELEAAGRLLASYKSLLAARLLLGHRDRFSPSPSPSLYSPFFNEFAERMALRELSLRLGPHPRQSTSNWISGRHRGDGGNGRSGGNATDTVSSSSPFDVTFPLQTMLREAKERCCNALLWPEPAVTVSLETLRVLSRVQSESHSHPLAVTKTTPSSVQVSSLSSPSDQTAAQVVREIYQRITHFAADCQRREGGHDGHSDSGSTTLSSKLSPHATPDTNEHHGVEPHRIVCAPDASTTTAEVVIKLKEGKDQGGARCVVFGTVPQLLVMMQLRAHSTSCGPSPLQLQDSKAGTAAKGGGKSVRLIAETVRMPTYIVAAILSTLPMARHVGGADENGSTNPNTNIRTDTNGERELGKEGENIMSASRRVLENVYVLDEAFIRANESVALPPMRPKM